MRNINELIGIIKGINFDGIINDKEVARLQVWVDTNRNLAYEKRQIELVKRIDDMLEDRIIDDEERKTLLNICDLFAEESVDTTTKIYELNGIIEGIICDGEVNKQEIERLKAWMDTNREFVKGHKTSDSLCKMIDSILADGVVTEEEQEQLLQLLSVRIGDSKFDTKLEFLKKQVREKENIGIDLIDLLDNDNAMRKIHNQAEMQLRRTLNSYTGNYIGDQEILFISLVLIAMLHYDGNYYESVRTTYKELYRDFTEQKIEGLIRTVLNRYRTNVKEKSGKSRIINIALTNTIVPGPFLKSFFEFIYDIYKLNFEYTLSDDMKGDFKFVYEGLRTNMLSDGDEVNLNVTKKSYKLIKSTKQLILDEKYINSVIKLSIIVAKLIDKRMWNKEIKIFNPYLRTGYEGWIETLKDESVHEHHRTKSAFRSRWEPKFMLYQNEVYIVPPAHRVKAQYNYRDIRVVIKNNDSEIYVNDLPSIKEIIGGYQVTVDRIKIDCPLGTITYQLLADNEVLYSSKEKLHRSFIVFDHDGQELQNNTNYTGTAVFCAEEDVPNVKTYFKGKNYKLASINVHQGDSVFVNNMVFNFSSFIKPGIFGEKWEDHSLIIAGTQDKIPVYKNVQYLVFEASKSENRIEIVLDNKRNRLEDFEFSVTEREGITKYVVKIGALKDGVHSVEVNSWNNSRKNKILSLLLFAIDEKLTTELLEVDENSYMISIVSGLLPLTITEVVAVESFDEKFISFNIGERKYYYMIPFPFGFYRIDENDWKSLREDLWIGNIKQDSIFEIYGLNVDELQIYGGNGCCINDSVKFKNKGVYKQVAIGFLLSYKVSHDYVMLVFLKDGIKQKTVFCYMKCVLDKEKTEFVYDTLSKGLDIIPRFYGKGNVYYTITDKRGDVVYRSSYVENGVIDSIYTTLESFEKYVISFYEKEKGLRLKGERLLGEFEKVFYAREDFVGRSFKISEVLFDQLVRRVFERKHHYFNTTYIYFSEQISDDSFVGDVYNRTSKGAYMLNNINPVYIEFCSDVIDGKMELAITKDGDGLLLDFEHHCIMNTLDDDSAVDIFSYMMDMDGVKTF